MIQFKKLTSLVLLFVGLILFSTPLLAANLTISITTSSPSCNGGTDGSVTVDVITGDGNFNYYLTTNQYYPFPGYVLIDSYENEAATSVTFNNLSADNYLVLAIDVDASIDNGPATLTELPALSGGVIQVTSPLSCYDGNDAEFLAQPSGGTGAGTYTYEWFFDDVTPPSTYLSTGVTTVNYTLGERGRYQVRVDDANGCGPVSSTSLTFIEFISPDVPTALLTVSGSGTPACEAGNEGSINITGNGGWPAYNYSIVNSLAVTTGPQASNTFNNLVADTYETWITDDEGCTVQGNDVVISSTTSPTVDAGSAGETCEETPIDLSTLGTRPSESNTSSLSWDDGGAGGSFNDNEILEPQYTPPLGFSGNITLTLTGAGNTPCPSANDAMILTVTAAPDVDAGSNEETCEDAMFDLSTSGTQPSQSGTSSLEWNASVGGGSFNNDAILMPQYTPPAGYSGNITLTLTGYGNGSCPSTNDPMTLSVTAAPAVNAGSNESTCQDTEFDLATSGTPPSESNTSDLTWTASVGGGSFDNNKILLTKYTPPLGYVGNITLTLFGDGNGSCPQVNHAMTLTVVVAPSVSAGNDGETCENSPYDLSTSIPAPTEANTTGLTWSASVLGGSFDDASALQPIYTPPAGYDGTITLTLTGTNGGICPDVISTMDLTVTDAPEVNAGGDEETCEDTAYDLANSTPLPTESSTSLLTWTASVGGGSFDDPNILMTEYTPPLGYTGNITLTLRGDGNGSCAFVTDDMVLSVTGAPSVNAGSDGEICEDGTYDLSTSAPIVPSESGTSTISWSDNRGGSFDDPSALQPEYTPLAGYSGLVTLTLTGFGNGSCPQTSNDMTLTVTAEPAVVAGNDGTTCEDTPFDLSTTVPPPTQGNTSGLNWTAEFPGGNFDNAGALQPIYTPPAGFTGEIDLTLTGTGNGSCPPTNDFMTLTVYGAAFVDAGGAGETCEDVSYDLSNSLPNPSETNTTGVSWDDDVVGGSFNNPNALIPIYTPPLGYSGPITLTITGTGQGPCPSLNDDMTLSVTAGPSVNAGSNEETCEDTPFDLSTSTTVPSESNTLVLTWDDLGLGGGFDNANTLLPIYTPPLGHTGNVTLRLTGTGNGSCTPVSSTMTLSVTTAPSVNAGSDEETCEDTPINLALSGTPPTASFANPLTWDDGPATGSFNNISALHPVYTPPAGFSGNITLTLSGTGGGSCPDVNHSMTLTVTAAPSVSAGSDEQICENTILDLSSSTTIPTETNTVSLKWTSSEVGGSFDDDAILLPEYTPPFNFDGTIILTLTGTGNGSCPDAISTMTLDVTPEPEISAGGDEETCQDTPYSLINSTPLPSESSTSFLSWSDGGAGGSFNNPNILFPTYTPLAGSTVDVTLTLSATGIGACLPTNDFMILSITAAPTVNAGGDGETCENMDYDLSTSVPPPSESETSLLTWSASEPGGSFDNANALQPIYTPPLNFDGTITLTLTGAGNGSCPAAISTMELTVTNAPLVDAGSAGETCQDTDYDLSTSTISPSGSSTGGYSWAADEPGGSFDNVNALQPIYTPPAGFDGLITLTLTGTGLGSCADTDDFMELTVTPAPTLSAGGDGETCENMDYNLATSVPPPSETNTGVLAWSADEPGGSFNDENILQPIYTPPANFDGTITLTVIGAGTGSCPAVNSNMTLTVTNAAEVGAGGDGITCQDTDYDLSTSTPAPSNLSTTLLTWDDDGEGGSFNNVNALEPIYSPPAGFDGTITLTLTGDGGGSCTSVSDSMDLRVYAEPTVSAGGDGETCENMDYDLSLSIPQPSETNTVTGSWDDNSAGGSFNNPNTLMPVYTPPLNYDGSITLTLDVTGFGTCPPVSDDMILTVTDAPVVSAGSDGETCQDVDYDLSSSATIPSESLTDELTWDDGAAGGSFSDNKILLPVYTPPLGFSGDITLTLTGSGTGSCADVMSSMTLNVTIVQTVDAGSDGETCMDTDYNLSSSTTRPSQTDVNILTWNDGGIGGSFNNINALEPIYTPPLGFTGNITLTLSGSSLGSCPDVSDFMTLTIWDPPAVSVTGPGETCEDTPINLLTVFPSANFTSSTLWDDDGTGGIFDDPAALITNYTPPAGYEGDITITLTGSGNSTCVDASDNFTLTVTPAPNASAGTDQNVCYGEPVTLNGAVTDNDAEFWDASAGDGTFDNDLFLDAEYTPGPADLAAGTVTLTLTATGNGSCADDTDDVIITIAPELTATIGAPTPFLISATTQISVSVKVEGHDAIHDLSYFLQAPNGSRVTLADTNDYLLCNYADEADVTFTNNGADPILNICSTPFFPGIPLSGTYRAEEAFDAIYGLDPANGAWAIVVTDCDYNVPAPTDGTITTTIISFTDISTITGLPETVEYRDEALSVPINQSSLGGCGETVSTAPIGLRTSCWNTCDANALVTVTGGTPTYDTYTWNPLPDGGNGTDDVVLCAGTYDLTVIDNMGCESTTSVTVTSPDSITITSVDVTDSVSCFGGADGSISIDATGGIGVMTYTLLPATPSEAPGTGLFTGLTAGSYTIRMADGALCAKDTVITIAEPTQLLLTSATVTNAVYCAGDTDGEIQMAASGGTEPYTFILEQIPGVDITNNTGLFTNLGPGSYWARLTDDNDCDTIDGDTLVIGIPVPLTIDTVLNEEILCNGDSARIGVVVRGGNPGYAVILNGGTPIPFVSDSIFTIQPNAVTGKDAFIETGNGADNNNYGNHIDFMAADGTAGGVDILVRSLIEFDLSSIPAGIMIDSAILSLYAHDSPQNSTHSDFSGSNESILQRATSTWDEATVTWNTQPTVTTTNQVVLPAGGTGVVHFENIDITAMVQDMIDNPASNFGFLYRLQTEIEHRKMVFASSDHSIDTLHPKLVIHVSSSSVGGDTLYLNLPHGDYDIEVEDSRGCSETWPLTITKTQPTELVIDSVQITDVSSDYCFYDPEGEIIVYAQGGTGSLEYSSDGYSYQPSNVFANLPGGIYNVSVRDDNGCVVSQYENVDGPPLPHIDTVVIQDVDGDSLGSIELFVSGGRPYTLTTPPYQYALAPISDPLILGTENLFTKLDTGVYHYQVIDSAGCLVYGWDTVSLVQLNVTITIDSAKCYDTGYDPPLQGRWTIEPDTTATPPYIVQWWTENDSLTEPWDLNLDPIYTRSLEPGTYRIHIEDDIGRSLDDTIIVGSPDDIYYSSSSTQISCVEYNIATGEYNRGGAISIYNMGGGIGGFSFDWDDIPDDVAERDNLEPGMYIVDIVDANNCVKTDTFDLVSEDTLAAILQLVDYQPNGDYSQSQLDTYPSSDDESLCLGSTWLLRGGFNPNMDSEIGNNYFWTPDTIFNDNGGFERELTTTHPVTIRFEVRNSRCMDYKEITLGLYDTIGMGIATTVYRIADTAFNQINTGLQLTATTGYIDYLWTSDVEDEFSSDITPITVLTTTEDQVIAVRGTTPDGCYESDTLYLLIRKPIGEYYEVFTPNGDGFNDEWIVPNAAQYPELEVTIFNRWGQQVFYSSPYGTDINHTFNGKSQKNGKDLPIGSYYFIINPNDGEQEPISGTVTIVR